MTVSKFTVLYAPSALRRLLGRNGPPTSLVSVDSQPPRKLDEFLSRSDRRTLRTQIGANVVSLDSGGSYRKVHDETGTCGYEAIVGNMSRVEVLGEANIRTVDYELIRDEV